jgi:integrase/recombinase XerC
VEQRLDIAGAAHLHLIDGVRHLRPEEAVVEAMLAGFAGQQSSRMLSVVTIAQREAIVRRFAVFTGSWPWEWTATDVEDWTTALRSANGHGSGPRAHSTIRGYQNCLALFMAYLTDRRYRWGEECQQRFGTYPVQICHEWNTTAHVTDHEARPQVRPFTRVELQKFFDFADDQVTAARAHGVKGALAAFRDATLFKVIYAFGLRRTEAAMLDLADFTRNPAAPEFGRYGACTVRYAKPAAVAHRGGAPCSPRRMPSRAASAT